MKTNLVNQFRHQINNSLGVWQWCALAVASWVLFRFSMLGMETLYAQTLHPVSVMKGQLTFDGDLIKSYYAVMQSHGSLSTYFFVQCVDFAFMLTMFLAMACMTIAAYRVLPDQKHLKNLAWCIVLVAPLAPVFDALENGVSFFMITNPQDFANWLAYPYSSFAAIKYGLSGLGFVWTVVAVSIGLLAYVYASVCKFVVSRLRTN